MPDGNCDEGGATDVKAPAPRVKDSAKPKPKLLPPYHVVLLNDDDHSYDYVIEMLRGVFGHDEVKGFRLAKQVDKTGRAIVLTTHREHAELKCEQIMTFGADLRVASCQGSMSAVIEPAEG